MKHYINSVCFLNEKSELFNYKKNYSTLGSY